MDVNYIVMRHIMLTPHDLDKVISKHTSKIGAYLSMFFHSSTFMPCRVVNNFKDDQNELH